MDQTQFQHYCRAQGLTPEACDLIARIRLSQPVRRVQGRAGNVCGFYPSRKMGVTIQFESQSVELGAIYLLDHDEAVLEFYDQPHTFNVIFILLIVLHSRNALKTCHGGSGKVPPGL